MYLKALEIQGFKSFPVKTRLTFDKAVTAIVGPNGSGKSNISDAVQWVMGEQSTRALRGGKMEDVIFGGTAKRGPVGFAEVSLILDNADRTFDLDSTEVMITRRYYRSGESEYYINRTSCRLKDINELLMDTGLGREGYCIIGQGRIDEILSAAGTERREVFEEAAGISRFRHRKEESENKLQRSEENLLRVGDKIAELELQVEPLRRQSEVAKQYLACRDELRGLEIAVWTESLGQIAQNAETGRLDLESAKRQLDGAKAKLESLYAEGETFSAKMQEKDLKAEEIRGLISAAESKIAELDSAAAVLRANEENNRSGIQRMGRELTEQEDRDAGLSGQIGQRKNRLEEIKNQKQTVAGETERILRESAQAEAASGEAEKQLGALVARENGLKTKLAAEKAALTALAGSVQELEDRSAGLIAGEGEAAEKLKTARAEETENGKKLTDAREARAAAANVVSGYQLRLSGRRAKASAAADKRVRVAMEANAVSSRAAMLAEMEKEYQGFSKSVKTVMQESVRGTLKGVRGPAGNLLRVSDDYALAVETAMGGAMQDVVVDDEDAGKACIRLLKARDAGRATFLPVSVIRGGKLSEPGLDREDGFLGVAAELAEYEEKYAGVFASLLGRTAVADTLDSAVRIGKKYRNRFRIVTLDGQLVNAGGSMTGGSAAKNTGILSRSNELKRLEAQQDELKKSLSEAQKAEEDAKRELAAAEYELKVSEDEMRTAENDILRLETAEEHYRLLLEALEGNLAALKEDASGVREKIAAAEAKIAESRETIEGLEQELQQAETDIASATSGSSALQSRRDELSASVAELRTKEASLDAESETLLRAVAELETLRTSLSGGRQQQLAAIEDMKQKNRAIASEIAEKEREAAEQRAFIAERREDLSRIAQEKLELEAARTGHNRSLQDKNNEVLNLERECARLEQKLASFDADEKQLVDKLWDTYELSRSDAMAAKKPLDDPRGAARRIAALKKEMAGLGNPNLGAIEEFERVNTRYTYLTGQRDDIEKAKKELEELIGEITGQMREIFAREFARIREAFQATFAELFGGGTADLVLEDEDILSCGIDIRVQPPGKSLKTLTLLSGGEKAFVAIALYFAILKVRPTPFVIMDEIEAALDEENVVRFARYLRRYAENTQFLVITHRRGTMEEADVLYGVTMQEQGVTQVISVDLEEAEKTLVKK